MSVVLGMDAGGSKTLAAWVARDGRLLDLARTDGVDPTRTDDPGRDLLALFKHLTHGRRPCVAATLGLPYFGEIASLTMVQERVAAEFFGPLGRACNDVEVAHIGAFAGGDGLLCLAGTGSMAWAKGPAGSVRVGGFGDLIGDEGSAFWIGRAAIAALSREADGRNAPSPFGAALAQAARIVPGELIDWTYRHPSPRSAIARLARHVADLAATGDLQARAIIVDAAAELAAAGQAAARQAGLGEQAPWAAAGSVFLGKVLTDEVARLLGSPPQKGILPPVGGAALDAARRAGWDVDDDWIKQLHQDLQDFEAQASRNVKEAI